MRLQAIVVALDEPAPVKRGYSPGQIKPMSSAGTNHGDKLDRWIGHMAHLAVGIEFVPKCWVCEMGKK